MAAGKRRFDYAEKYAVWHCNEKRCWWCGTPLRLYDVTVDHVLPESLLRDDDKRLTVFEEYDLPQTFNIDGFENWLPCCNHCNLVKGQTPPTFTPGTKRVLDRLWQQATDTRKVADSVPANVTKDKVLKTLIVAIEKKQISVPELDEFLRDVLADPPKGGMPADAIILDRGDWVRRDEIVSEGKCRCERTACVGHRRSKVYCYFKKSQSPWVITSGLYWKCYDEIVTCPRCSVQHKRGHIGRATYCGRPYLNQSAQTDLRPVPTEP